MEVSGEPGPSDGYESDLNDSPAPLGSQPDAPHLCMAPRMPFGEPLAKRSLKRLDASWRSRNQNWPRSSSTPAKRRKRPALSGERQLPAVEVPPQACSRQSSNAPLFNKLPPTTLAPAPPEESTPLTAREQSVPADQSDVSKAPGSKGDASSRLLILPPNARRACADAPMSPQMHFSPERLVSPYSIECLGRSPDTPGTPDAVSQRRYRGKASPASFEAAVPSALMRPARFAQPQQFHRQHISGIVHSATKRPTVPTSCHSQHTSGKSWVVSPQEWSVAEVEKAPRDLVLSVSSSSKILFKIPSRCSNPS